MLGISNKLAVKGYIEQMLDREGDGDDNVIQVQGINLTRIHFRQGWLSFT